MENFQLVSYIAKQSKDSVVNHRNGECGGCKETKTVGTLVFDWKRDRSGDWDFDQEVICKDCLVERGQEVVVG